MPTARSAPDSARSDRPELEAARAHRVAEGRTMTMPERLAALHHLCAQLTPLLGAARRRL